MGMGYGVILEQLSDGKVTNKVRMQHANGKKKKKKNMFSFSQLPLDMDDAEALRYIPDDDDDDHDGDGADAGFMTMGIKGFGLFFRSLVVEKKDDVELDTTFFSFLYAMFVIMARRNEQVAVAA